MELIEVLGDPSRSIESSRASEEELPAPRKPKRMRKPYGIEREAAAESSKKKNSSPFRVPGNSRSSSAPKTTSRRKNTTSIFSQDPPSITPVASTSIGRKGRVPADTRSDHDRSLSPQEHQRRLLEDTLDLQRSLARQSDDDEISEPIEEPHPFPLERSRRSEPKRPRSSLATTSVPPASNPRTRAGRTGRTSNSSPIRAVPATTVISSSEEEEEVEVEERPKPAKLSPDPPPPRVIPKSSKQPGAVSRISKMQKKDGTVPGAALSSRPRDSFFSPRPTRSYIPSSNITNAPQPAMLDWVMIEAVDEDKDLPADVPAESVSLRRKGTDQWLEFMADSKVATVALDYIRSVVTNHRDFLRLKVRLSPEQRRAFEDMSQYFYERDVFIMLALKEEEGSQRLIERLGDCLSDNIKVETVLNETVKGFKERRSTFMQAKKRRAAPASKAAEAAEKRAKEGSKSAKSKGALSPSQPKLTFEGSKPRRSARNSAAAGDVTTLSDDEPNPATTTSGSTSDRRRSPRLDKHEVLFPYPFTGRSSLDITRDSLYRLLDGDFLNDVTLEFGLRFTVANAPPRSLHLFNSFFYNKLSSRDKKPKDADDQGWAAYESVKKWTKAVDVFQQDFIIVPVNENLHWYLAVIFNPRAVIEPRRSASVQQPGSKAGSTSVSARGTPMAVDDKDSPGRDPLDCISEGESGMDDIKERVDECHISPKPPSPKPIQSFTLDCMQAQDTMEVSSPSPPKPRKTHMREPCDLRDSNTTYILTFDSLGGSHKAVGANLKRWLECEAREKLQKSMVSEPVYLEAKVPQQDNFSDCGVFVIHYLWCLLNETDKVLDFIGKPPPYAKEQEARAEYDKEMNTVWHANNTPGLRIDWVGKIHDLNDEWNAQNGANGGAQAESQSLVNGSQASVVQVNPPEAAVSLPPVDENHATESAAADREASAGKGILSPSPAAAARLGSRSASVEAESSKPVIRRSRIMRSPMEDVTEHPDPPSPVLGPSAARSPPREQILSDSESEGSPQPPSSRAHSTSTKTSSKEEVDRTILVEDSQSQPKSGASSSSVLFSSEEARSGQDHTTPVPETLPPEPLAIDDSSKDGRVNRIDLSSDHDIRYDPAVTITKGRRDSSRLDPPSSPPPSSPPASSTKPAKRRGRASAGEAKQKQGILSAYFQNNSPAPASKSPSEEQPERQAGLGRGQPYVEPPPTLKAGPKVTYKKEAAKRKVSAAAAKGSEPKRARTTQGHEGEVGGSSQNPIDLDPSDDEA